MTYPASVIAFAFVEKGISENNPVTQMKLQKMVYFAHGYHLARFGEPLVEEIFQAWRYGPVVPSIYHAYKLYGSSPIRDTNFVFDTFTGALLNNPPIHGILIGRALEAIEYTWLATKDLSAASLSNWSHKSGAPWAKVYIENGSNIPIPDDSIKVYFRQLLTRPDGAAT